MIGPDRIACRWIPCAALLAMFAGFAGWAVDATAEPHAAAVPNPEEREPNAPWRRWAILCAPEVRQTPFGDLLTAELTGQRDLELVERDDLAKIEEEIKLGQLLGAGEAAERLSVGRMLRADALVLVRRQGTHPEAPLRIVIAECLQGARLHEQDVPGRPVDEAAHLAADVVQSARRRFPGGIYRLVAVSDFVSRNLTHDFDPLQRQYADLLRGTLSLGEGVAVLEIEEARTIARERASLPIDHPLPLIVEGEFRVDGIPGQESATAELIVRILGGGRPQPGADIRSPKLPLPRVPAWIAGELAATILPRAGRDESLDSETACGLLDRRADEFSRLGAYDHSIPLREAALLLRPSWTEPRLKLIEDCLATVQRPSPLKADEIYPGSPAIREKYGRKVDAILQAQEHAEHLIRNRRIDRAVALRLAAQLGPHGTLASGVSHEVLQLGEKRYYRVGQEELARAQKPTRRFLLEVAPLILDLPPSQRESEAVERRDAIEVGFHENWFQVYRNGVASRTDVHYLIPRDLDDLIRAYGQIPNDLPFVPLLGQPTTSSRDGPRAATSTDYEAFYRALAESGPKGFSLSGRFMLLQQRFEKEIVSAVNPNRLEAAGRLREELAALAAEYDAQPRLLGGKSTINDSMNRVELDRFRREIDDALRSLGADVARPHRSVPRAIDPHEPTTGAVRFAPIELRIAARKDAASDDGPPSPDDAFPAAGLGLVSCGPKRDALWCSKEVYWMDQPDRATEIHHDSSGAIVAAAWDGRILWVSRRDGGIVCLAPDGARLAEVGQAEGLPPAEHGAFVHPLSPGRVLAMGSFGHPQRAWAATVVLGDAEKPVVEVLFEATDRIVPGATSGDQDEAIRVGFRVSVSRLYQPHAYQPAGETGRPVLLAQRSLGKPLAIRLDTLSIAPFPCERLAARDLLLHSRDGVLLVTGGSVAALIAPPGQTWPDGTTRRRIPLNNPPAPNPAYQDLRTPEQVANLGGSWTSGQLWVVEPGDGYLYYVGRYWYRIDLKTYRADLLASNPMPAPWSACTQFAVSAHHGMIAWRCGVMHRITIDSDALPKPGDPIFK